MRHLLFSLLLLSVLPLMATEQAFPPTAPGVAEFKTLPAGVLLKSTGRGSYFDESNRLFRPLFNYISTQKIAMTTPVEAQIDQAAMYFWVAPSEVAKVAGNRDGVEVIRIPERQVASLGGRGGYGRVNFEQARDKLLAWLADHPEVKATGDAYAVYWHGPFTPWFAKRFEVHIPVRTKPTTP
ncbi:MAG: hypothetical protein RLZZ129_1695 [Verrucomicrobiota bacterium]|jgi:effector-binding domain-containing protein